MVNKIRISTIVITIIFALLLSACKKDSSSTTSTTLPGSMSTTISDGFSCSFDAANATYSTAYIANQTVYTITSTYTSDVGNISITFLLYSLSTGSQTISLGDTNKAYVARTIKGGTSTYDATNGTLYITENNSSDVKGTFNFSAVNSTDSSTISVSSGTFVSYK